MIGATALHISVVWSALYISDIFRADKIINSVLIPLLARLNPHLDPTSLITLIPKGTRMTQWHKNIYKKIKKSMSNFKQLEHKASQKQAAIQALYPFWICKPQWWHNQITLIERLRSGRVNLAWIFAASSESWLPNAILSLHSATVLNTFLQLVFE